MKEASRLVLITGPEPLIIEETLDEIRSQRPNAERLRFGAGEKIDWPLLEGINREIPMFSPERLVEVRLDGARLDKKAIDCLHQILDNPSPDCFFVLVRSAVTKAETNSAWYKAIVSKGSVLSHKKVEGEAFTKWMRARFAKTNIQCDLEAEVLLTHYLEGNLLAGAQQVELLALTVKEQKVTLEDVERSVVDSGQFGDFSLNEALLAGDSERCIRIMQQMRADKVSAVKINAAITRELTSAYDVARNRNNPERLKAVTSRLRIWPRRQQQLLQMAKRIGSDGIDECLNRSARIDLGNKGRLNNEAFDVWDELAQLVCRAGGQPTALHPEMGLRA